MEVIPPKPTLVVVNVLHAMRTAEEYSLGSACGKKMNTLRRETNA